MLRQNSSEILPVKSYSYIKLLKLRSIVPLIETKEESRILAINNPMAP
jgi:hypothetical protein